METITVTFDGPIAKAITAITDFANQKTARSHGLSESVRVEAAVTLMVLGGIGRADENIHVLAKHGDLDAQAVAETLDAAFEELSAENRKAA